MSDEGYHDLGDDDQSRLDEFLCEYVDGTMDPAVCRVFEEYLEVNPELREHVRYLRDTRRLLCRYGCRLQAPEGLQARIRRQLSYEMMRARVPIYANVTGTLFGVTSAMMLLLMVGMVVPLLAEADKSHPVAVSRLAAPADHTHRAQAPSLYALRTTLRDRPAVHRATPMLLGGRSDARWTSHRSAARSMDAGALFLYPAPGDTMRTPHLSRAVAAP